MANRKEIIYLGLIGLVIMIFVFMKRAALPVSQDSGNSFTPAQVQPLSFYTNTYNIPPAIIGGNTEVPALQLYAAVSGCKCSNHTVH